MRVVLYARVSTSRQAEKDLSVPEQLEQLRAWANQNGHEVVREYREDGASARDEKRPVFAEMMSEVLSKNLIVDAICVLTLDRFYRNQVLFGLCEQDLKKRGVRVVALRENIGLGEESPDANFVKGLHSLMAQYESEKTGWRTQTGMKANFRKGHFNGGVPPFGFRSVPDGNHFRLEIEPEEAETVKRMFDLYANQALGAGGVIEQLYAEKRYARGGKHWTKPTVLKMLRNPLYIGQYVYNRFDSRAKIEKPQEEWILIDVPAIVDADTFKKAEGLAAEKSPMRKKGRTPSSPLILSGMAYCGTCGAKLHSARTCGYAYYQCHRYNKSGKSACKGNRARVELLNQAVIDTVVNQALSFQRALKITSGIRRLQKSSADRIEALKLRLAKSEAKRKKYLAAFENDRLDARAVNERLKELETEEMSCKDEIVRLEGLTELPDVGLWDIEEMIQKVHDAVRRQDNPQLLRRFLCEIIESVTLDGKRVVIKAKEEGFTGLVTKFFGSGKEWQPVGESNPCDRTEN